ncbi:hypothetical protein [Amphritea sp. HPY]|uniref:hypothetical protein n=1 Tax=Amphritea sp. HPY TaxID=3421652 RepID=UPI003D7DCF54
MKYFLIILALLSNSSFAGDICDFDCKYQRSSPKTIVDDGNICSPIERNKFKEFTRNLKEIYGTTLKDSYFEIECNGKDLLGMIVDSPAGSYMASLHMQKYFEKDEKIPEMFSHILLNKVNTRNILDRIEIELDTARRNDDLRGSIVEKRLLKMKTKYTAYLKKYPVD